jgi:Clustered mitochondria
VAGHELKGLVAYFSLGIEAINVPMMALVDYRGFRLIAMCLLPISKGSLKYGSNDAGRTVHCDNRRFARVMRRAGRELNLRKHWCGWSDESRKLLWAAADVEGHMGDDGKFYMVCCQRSTASQPVSVAFRFTNRYVCFEA